MADPRLSMIDERLNGISNILAISSGKGGVGKSLVASTLGLILAKRNYEVGLLDIDFTSPSTHIILNMGDLCPKEDKGIVPPEIYGLKYMSIVYYSREHPLPLRGIDVSNVLAELFAVTIWGNLDFLIIDMPPGISDAMLDIIKLVKRIRFLIVTTSSQLAFETVRKLICLLLTSKIPVIGVIENMKMKGSRSVQPYVEEMDVKFWGEIPFDIKIEEALGDVDKLLDTEFSRKMEEISIGRI